MHHVKSIAKNSFLSSFILSSITLYINGNCFLANHEHLVKPVYNICLQDAQEMLDRRIAQH